MMEATLLLMLYGHFKMYYSCGFWGPGLHEQGTAFFQVCPKWQQPSESACVGPKRKVSQGQQCQSPHRPGRGGVPFAVARFEDSLAGALFDLCSLPLKRSGRPVIKYADSTSAMTGQPTS